MILSGPTMVNVASPPDVVKTSTSGVANVRVVELIVVGVVSGIIPKLPELSVTVPLGVLNVTDVPFQLSLPPVTPSEPLMNVLANALGVIARATASASSAIENFFIVHPPGFIDWLRFPSG